MAAPQDRVRLLKNESPSTGGTEDDLGFPAVLNPNEDAPSVRGIFLQGDAGEDEAVYLTRNGSGQMVMKDVAEGAERVLTDLVGGAATGVGIGVFLNAGGLVYNSGGDVVVKSEA